VVNGLNQQQANTKTVTSPEKPVTVFFCKKLKLSDRRDHRANKFETLTFGET